MGLSRSQRSYRVCSKRGKDQMLSYPLIPPELRCVLAATTFVLHTALNPTRCVSEEVRFACPVGYVVKLLFFLVYFDVTYDQESAQSVLF